MVLFRALNPARYACFLGPALAIVFTPHEEWGGDCIRASNLGKSVVVPKGFLHWDRATLDAIGDRRMVRLSWHVADYLREVAADETQGLSNEALRAKALGFIQEAKALGVTHDAAFAKWAYMRLIDSDAAFFDLVRQFMTDATLPHSADDRVKYLMQFQINQLKAAL